MSYHNKYLKYKEKYLLLKQHGGVNEDILYICNKEEPKDNADIVYILDNHYTPVTKSERLIKFDEIDRLVPTDKFNLIFIIMCESQWKDDGTIIDKIAKLKSHIKFNGIIYIKSTNQQVIDDIKNNFLVDNFKILSLPSSSLVSSLDKQSVSSVQHSFKSLPHSDVVESECYYTGVLPAHWEYQTKKKSWEKYSPTDSKYIDDMYLEKILNPKTDKKIKYTYTNKHDGRTAEFEINFGNFVDDMSQTTFNQRTKKIRRNGYYISRHGDELSTLARIIVVLENEAYLSKNKKYSQESLRYLAHANMSSFRYRIVDKCVINVMNKDWSIATRELTAHYGTIFAVLNMANGYKFGGGYRLGSSAQEENMFRTTDCMTYAHGVYHTTQKYTQEMIDLINGQNGRVLLDTCDPRVIIRNSDYKMLKEEEYIPFYELRAAAIDATKAEFTKDACEKRIRAQIETLKEHKVRHVILSAFGCGAFKNPPNEVAIIYKKVIYENLEHFSVIIFTIFNPTGGSDRNYEEFIKHIPRYTP